MKKLYLYFTLLILCFGAYAQTEHKVSGLNTTTGQHIDNVFRITQHTSNPTVNDDVDLGYREGNIWVNVTGDSAFILLDTTNGAAVWRGINIIDSSFVKIFVDTIQGLNMDSVYFNSPILIVDIILDSLLGFNSDTIFSNSSFIFGSGKNIIMASDGLVDGINISDSVNQNVTTTGSPTFVNLTADSINVDSIEVTGTIDVTGDMTISGLVDGINISDSIDQDVSSGADVTFDEITADSIYSDTITGNYIRVNEIIYPDADGGADIGESGLEFGDGHIDSVFAVHYGGQSDFSIGKSTEALTIGADSTTFKDSLFLEGLLAIESVNGIDLIPGSDTDHDWFTSSVTGTPRFFWDESQSGFAISTTNAGGRLILQGASGDDSGIKMFEGTDEKARIWYNSGSPEDLKFWVGGNYIMDIVPDGELKFYDRGETNPTVTAGTFSIWPEDANGAGTVALNYKTEDGISGVLNQDVSDTSSPTFVDLTVDSIFSDTVTANYIRVNETIYPDANGGADIGETGLEFGDAHVDSVFAVHYGGQSDFSMGVAGEDLTIGADKVGIGVAPTATMQIRGDGVSTLGFLLEGNAGTDFLQVNDSLGSFAFHGTADAAVGGVKYYFTNTDFRHLMEVNMVSTHASAGDALLVKNEGTAAATNTGIRILTTGATGGAAANVALHITSGNFFFPLANTNTFNIGHSSPQTTSLVNIRTKASNGAFKIVDSGVLHSFVVTDDRNVGIIATTFGTNADGVFGMGLGTAPTTRPANMFQMYPVDANGAGTTSLRLMTEDNTAITLATTSLMKNLTLSEDLTVDTVKALHYGGQSDFSMGITGEDVTIGSDTLKGSPIWADDLTITDSLNINDIIIYDSTITCSTPLRVSSASGMSIDITGTGNSYMEIIQDNNAGYLALGRTDGTESSMLSITDGNADNKPGFLQLYDDGGQPLYWWVSTDNVFRAHTGLPADDDGDGYAIMDIDDGTIGATDQPGIFSNLTVDSINVDTITITSLTASQIVETDAGKNLVSIAKKTGYNKEIQVSYDEAITTGGTGITFATALSTTNYALTLRCFDGSGNPVAVTITNKATTGFTATPAINANLDYTAIIK